MSALRIINGIKRSQKDVNGQPVPFSLRLGTGLTFFEGEFIYLNQSDGYVTLKSLDHENRQPVLTYIVLDKIDSVTVL